MLNIFNLKTSVELYCERLMLEFKGVFAEICLTVGWLLLSPNFGKNPFKFGVLAALATSSTAVFRFKGINGALFRLALLLVVAIVHYDASSPLQGASALAGADHSRVVDEQAGRHVCRS